MHVHTMFSLSLICFNIYFLHPSLSLLQFLTSLCLLCLFFYIISLCYFVKISPSMLTCSHSSKKRRPHFIHTWLNRNNRHNHQLQQVLNNSSGGGINASCCQARIFYNLSYIFHMRYFQWAIIHGLPLAFLLLFHLFLVVSFILRLQK